MVASVDGNSLGLGNSSLNTLDLQRGDAATGRNGEAVYVNAATGNLVVQHLDELLVGLGPDLPVLRTYNSQAQVDGDNDDDWRIGLSRRLVDLDGDVNRAGSAITRIDGDGARTRYRYDASRGLYLNTDGAGAYDTLAYDGIARLWAWTDGDSGVRETYQQDAATGHRQLIRQQDADGNSVLFSYAVNGLLQKVASANSQGTTLNQVELVYDALPGQTANLLFVRSVAWDAATGANLSTTRVRYSYDARQRLASVSVDLSPDDNSIADGHVYLTRYSYDGDSNRLRRISQSDGSQIDITWKEVDDEQRVASLVNAQGELTRYDYDSKSRVTTVTDPMGFETRYAHDSAGRLLQITAPPVDGLAQIRQFVYNDNGDVLRIIDGKGQVTERSYDRNGLLLRERDAAGNTVVRSYNAQNQLLSVTRYLQPDPDGAGPATAAEPQTTRYVYDPVQGRRLCFVVSAEGRVTEHRYNALGQRVSEIQYTRDLFEGSATADALQLEAWLQAHDLRLALRTDFNWDYRGQLQSQVRYTSLDAQGEGVADGSEAVTHYIYSASGQLLQTIAPEGGVTQFAHDGMGREILRSNALGEITRTHYDDAGNRSLVIAANGLHSTLQYDSAGRLLTTLQSDPDGVLLSRSDYYYDDNGRLRATRDGTGVMHWMLYDAAGRKTADIEGNGSLSEYRYDANDQLTQTIQYATAVRALWPSVMDVEVFDYKDPGLAGDNQPPLFTSLAGLGLSDQAQGSVLTPVTRFQSSGFVAEDARHFAATANLKTYALRSSGSFTVFEAGDYSFYTRSNAGSRLYIDGQLVVDNDGLHEARTRFATVHLQPGVHSLVQTYFESTGAQVNQFGQGVGSDRPVVNSTMDELAQVRPPATNGDRSSWNLYDAAKRLVATVDARGSVKRLDYDGAGQIVRRIAHAGQIDVANLKDAPTPGPGDAVRLGPGPQQPPVP
jgi:YD repeat-containing protein